MPGKSHSAEPANTKPLKAYCSLREAFNLVGASIYGPKWRGFEADCDPARAAQPTDGKTLLRKLAPDGQSFSTKEKDRRPVPKRLIDGIHRARFGRAIGRHIKALKKLLHLLHSGPLGAEFIAENETTKKDPITASKWPDPAEFDPRNPTWNKLWFDIAADRVVLKSSGYPAVPGRAHSDGSLWWAYGERAGHVEIDREALERVLRPPEKAKESRAAQQRKKTPKPRGRGGRKPGSGAYTDQDCVLWEKMKKALSQGDATSPWDATNLFVKETPGRGNDDSKRRRLLKGYNGWIPNQ